MKVDRHCETCGSSFSIWPGDLKYRPARYCCQPCRDIGRIKETAASVTKRFWARVDMDGPVSNDAPGLGKCWLWLGGRNPHGYGTFSIDKHTRVMAYRFAYERLVGEIADGHELDHLCFVRACVRPSHLEQVTRLENIRRERLTHCPTTGRFLPLVPA